MQQDRAARLLLYRGDMDAEWASYPADAKAWTEAFAAGINAFIDETERGTQPLPLEFTATGSRPERWQADDVVRIRSNALASNLRSEVTRAIALCGGDVTLEPLRRKLEPPRPVTIPKGFDPCSIPENVLDDYTLGTSDVRFSEGAVVLASRETETLEGSNNWVIAPGRSTTGRPIMANDPHRAQSIPNLRYLSHIDTPELKIAGAGEPALPGISFGHNEDVAWALTIFAIDQQDLVVNPKGTRLTQVMEMIEVKGEAPREVALKFSADGPIIHEEPATGRSFALRATWSEPGGSAYFNAAWAYTARSWDDFLVARDRWSAPPLNLLFAGTNGDIGWAPGGFVPKRAAGDGLLPVPAGKRHRWKGLLDAALLPSTLNPPDGWLATANEMNVPEGYPHLLGLEWADPSRMMRVSEVIRSKAQFGITDSMALQNDITSPLARRAVALLAGLEGSSAAETSALAMLAGWDGYMGAEVCACRVVRDLGRAASAGQRRERLGAGADARALWPPAGHLGHPRARRRSAPRRRRGTRSRRHPAGVPRRGLDRSCRPDGARSRILALGPAPHRQLQARAVDTGPRSRAARRPASHRWQQLDTQRPELGRRFRRGGGPLRAAGHGCRRLGQQRGDQHARPVRQPGQRPLPRPLPPLGGGPLRAFPMDPCACAAGSRTHHHRRTGALRRRRQGRG